MRRVGLDPRRFDPTDDTEYQTGPGKDAKEEELVKKYGPRADAAAIKKLHVMEMPQSGKAIYLSEGRIFHGDLDTKAKTFRGDTGNGRLYTWKFKSLRGMRFYYAN